MRRIRTVNAITVFTEIFVQRRVIKMLTSLYKQVKLETL